MSLNKGIKVKERKGEMPQFSQIVTLMIQGSLSHFQGFIYHLCNDQDMVQLLCSFLCTRVFEHCCEWQNIITLARV